MLQLHPGILARVSDDGQSERRSTRSIRAGLTENDLAYPETLQMLRVGRHRFPRLGESAPLQAFSYEETEIQPRQANRHNRVAAASVSFNLVPGKTLSDAVAYVNGTMHEIGMPATIHGCAADSDNNIWLTGSEDGVLQKYTHAGKLLLQIGQKGVVDTSDGTGKGAPSGTAAPPIRTTWLSTSMPATCRRKARATAAMATRAAVSRALARSRTGRASSKPYFCIPERSA